MKILRGIFLKILCTAVIVLLIYVLGGWKIPIYCQINSLKLPEGAEIVYNTKVKFSDVYWAHFMGERVIKCEEGFEYAEDYILKTNSEKKLKNIAIREYFGMSDDTIYNSEYDNNFNGSSMTKEERNKYIKIKYYKKL